MDLDRDTYFSETPGGEAQLVPDLRSGRIDLAYTPARDWVATGDPGFRAVQYPFQVTTTEAAVALAGGAAASDLLAGMTSYGVVGLGLVPAEPRRLITKNPVLTAGDLQGSRIRISDSPETAELISSLGGEPVQGITAGMPGGPSRMASWTAWRPHRNTSRRMPTTRRPLTSRRSR